MSGCNYTDSVTGATHEEIIDDLRATLEHASIISKVRDEQTVDLLNACKGLIAQVKREGGTAMDFPPYKKHFDAIKAAIAKAEGRS